MKTEYGRETCKGHRSSCRCLVLWRRLNNSCQIQLTFFLCVGWQKPVTNGKAEKIVELDPVAMDTAA